PVPQGAGPSIRERSRICDPRTKGNGMHIHASHDISVASKATTPTGPSAAFRLLLPVTSRTMAAGSPLTATEARDANLSTFLLRLVLTLPFSPVSLRVVVCPSFVLVPPSWGPPNMGRLHPSGRAKISLLSYPFTPRSPPPPFFLPLFALPGVQEASPPLGAF